MTSNNKTNGANENLKELFHDLYLGKIIRLNDYKKDNELVKLLENDVQNDDQQQEQTKINDVYNHLDRNYPTWHNNNVKNNDSSINSLRENYKIKTFKELFENNHHNQLSETQSKQQLNKEKIINSIDKYEDNRDYPKKVGKSFNSYYLVEKESQVEIITDLFHFLESFLGGSDLTSTKPRNLLFRGQGSINYLNLPSLHRDAGHLSNEHKIYNELVTAYPEEFSSSNRHIDLLKLMQHYQLPTRLIDLTSNILVGLYFAVENNTTPTDAELQIFDANENTEKDSEEKHRVRDNNSDTVEILAALATQSFENKKDIYAATQKYDIWPSNISSSINEFNNEKPVTYLLHEIRRMVGDFEPIIDPRDLEKTLLVKTHLDNPRIINQKGSFLIVGLAGFEHLEDLKDGDELPVKFKDDVISSINSYRYKEQNDKKYTTYIIPAAFKTKIKKQLDLLNINQMYIYPDLSNGALYLKNLYSNNN